MKKILTLCIIYNDTHILLGMKKRGFGQGRWNGFGGKVEPNETIEQAAHREVKEEINVDIPGMIPRGTLTFDFEDSPDMLEVHLFSANSVTGEPIETDEMKPQWFLIDQIPYSDMWADDTIWLPEFIKGKNVKGSFHFKDIDTLVTHSVKFQ